MQRTFFPFHLRLVFWLIAALGFWVVANAALSQQGDVGPTDICGGESFGALGTPPRVTVSRDVELDRTAKCPEALNGSFKLFVKLEGRLGRGRTVDDLARRFGAVSATRGLPYWSVTDDGWRPLINTATALQGGPDGPPRADFRAAEVRSGRTLYFSQDDTRSTGTNIYAMTARGTAVDRLVMEVVNVSAIKLMFVTLFAPRSLINVHIFERLEDGAWGYRGLTGVRDGLMIGGYEKSFVNRAAAVYRFLAGLPADRDPPLAQ